MEQRAQWPQNVIVAGTDLGATGELALRQALQLAQKLPGAELHAVVVVPHEGTHSAEVIATLSDQLLAARINLGIHVRRVYRKEPWHPGFPATITLHARVGDPAQSIHQVAVNQQADFIVVGSHGRRGMRRWLDGSVSEELARIAHCPLIIAHPKDYSGLEHSGSIAPPRPGQSANDPGFSDGVEMQIPDRVSHIAGLL